MVDAADVPNGMKMILGNSTEYTATLNANDIRIIIMTSETKKKVVKYPDRGSEVHFIPKFH